MGTDSSNSNPSYNRDSSVRSGDNSDSSTTDIHGILESEELDANIKNLPENPPQHGRSIPIWRTALRFILPTLILLIGLEIIARAIDLPPYPRQLLRDMYTESDYSDFKLSSNYEGKMGDLEFEHSVITNNLGMRSDQTGDVVIDEDKTRILFIGDSMIFGQGVEYEESIAGLVDEGSKYQVFNAGVPSFGTIHSLGRLNEVGAEVQPDYVIYVMYPGNDFYDNSRGFIKYVIDGYLTEDPNFDFSKINDKPRVDSPAYKETETANFVDAILTNTSAFYRYMRYRSLFIPFFKEVYIANGITSENTCAIAYTTTPIATYHDQDEQLKTVYQTTTNAILDMKKFTEDELGAEFVIVHLPFKEQINTALWDYERKNGCIDPAGLDLYYPNKFIKEFSDENEIMLIDVTDALKEVFDSGTYPYFPIDSHINEIGHEIIAEEILEELNK